MPSRASLRIGSFFYHCSLKVRLTMNTTFLKDCFAISRKRPIRWRILYVGHSGIELQKKTIYSYELTMIF